MKLNPIWAQRCVVTLIAVCLALVGYASVSMAQIPSSDGVTDMARNVGSLDTQHLLALVCICLCILIFYLIRVLITMAKKPCIYKDKHD